MRVGQNVQWREGHICLTIYLVRGRNVVKKEFGGLDWGPNLGLP